VNARVVVVVGIDDSLSVRTDGNIEDLPSCLADHVASAAAHRPGSYGCIFAAGDQSRSAGSKYDAAHGVCVALQRTPFFTIRRIPEAYRVIPTGRRGKTTIGTERHIMHRTRMAGEPTAADPFRRCPLPEAQSLSSVASSDLVSVGAETHRVYGTQLAMFDWQANDLVQVARGHIPNAHRVIGASRYQALAVRPHVDAIGRQTVFFNSLLETVSVIGLLEFPAATVKLPQRTVLAGGDEPATVDGKGDVVDRASVRNRYIYLDRLARIPRGRIQIMNDAAGVSHCDERIFGGKCDALRDDFRPDSPAFRTG